MTQDLRYSIRLLLRHRRSTVATVLMLGLGLGANAALFVVVNAAFLRPLPFPDPDRLVFLYASFPGSSAADLANFSYPDFDDVRRSATSFEAIAAHTNFTAAAIETSDGPARVQPNFVDGPYFEILGAPAEMGRVFTEEETRTGARLMVLSHGTWEGILVRTDPSSVNRCESTASRSK